MSAHQLRLQQKKLRNQGIRESYARPPSLKHLKPALEQIERQHSDLYSQYESALKLSSENGKAVNLNHIPAIKQTLRV